MWLHLPGLASLSSPATVDSTSPSPEPLPAIVPSLMLRGKDLQLRSWLRAWRMRPFLKLLSGVTSDPSMLSRGADEWISSLADSRVRTSAMPESASASKEESDPPSGSRCLESFATFDRATSSWKTSQLSLFADLKPSSLVLPRSGSMRSGRLFERPTSAPPTAESDSSSSPSIDGAHWRTASSTDWKGVSAKSWRDRKPGEGDATPRLADQVDALKGAFAKNMYPTPTAQDFGSSQNGINADHPSGGTPSLSTWARDQWPTPTGADGGNSSRGGDRIEEKLLGGMARDWPTPRANDGTSGSDATANHEGSPNLVAVSLQVQPMPPAGENTSVDRRVLNPQFVEALMGLPIGWTAFVPLGMASCRRKESSRGESSGIDS